MRASKLLFYYSGAFAAAVALGCGGDSPTPPATSADAEAVISSFTNRADSLARTGATTLSIPTRQIAEYVRLAGRTTPIKVSLNGVSTDFLAVSRQVILPAAACAPAVRSGADSVVYLSGVSLPSPACMLSFNPSLLAWRGDPPTHLLLVSADTGKQSLGMPATGGPLPTFDPNRLSLPAFVSMFTTTSGIYLGRSGTVTLSFGAADGACGGAPILPPGVKAECQRASATASLAVTMDLLSDLGRGSSTGSMTLSMTPHKIAGSRIVVKTFPPPPPPPPRPLMLGREIKGAVTSAREGDGITFTFKLTSTLDTAVTLLFPTSREFTITVFGGTRMLWSSAASSNPTLTPVKHTLPARGTITYTAHWSNPTGGEGIFPVLASLASTNVLGLVTGLVSLP